MSLRHNNGDVVWAVNLNKNRRFKDIDSKPIIEGNRIYVTAFDDGLYCLERESGKVL